MAAAEHGLVRVHDGHAPAPWPASSADGPDPAGVHAAPGTVSSEIKVGADSARADVIRTGGLSEGSGCRFWQGILAFVTSKDRGWMGAWVEIHQSDEHCQQRLQ